MYAQLGNIIFENQNAFTSFSVDGDEANFAEFELINSKPRLQKVGDSLQQITIGIKLHAKFVNISKTLAQLATYKSDGEILPLLMGNGRYINDYVIVSMPFSVDDAFADGSIIEATLTLTLKEFVSYNKLEQQRAAARRSAFAVGNKKNVLLRAPAPLSIRESSAQNITVIKLQGLQVDNFATEIENNTIPSTITADKLKNAAQKALANINTLQDKINSNGALFAIVPDLLNASTILSSDYSSLVSAYPFSSIAALKEINLALQSNTRDFTKAGTPFLKSLIVRNG